MEKKCKNCKYFEPFKTMNNEESYKGWCGHNKLDMKHRVGSVGNALTVDIIGNCPFDIFVGINFGCIHFEEKQ